MFSHQQFGIENSFSINSIKDLKPGNYISDCEFYESKSGNVSLALRKFMRENESFVSVFEFVFIIGTEVFFKEAIRLADSSYRFENGFTTKDVNEGIEEELLHDLYFVKCDVAECDVTIEPPSPLYK